MKNKKLLLLYALIFFLLIITINKFQLTPYKQLKIIFYNFFPQSQIENKIIEDPIVNQYKKKENKYSPVLKYYQKSKL